MNTTTRSSFSGGPDLKPITDKEIEQELGISLLSNDAGAVWYADLVHGGHWKSEYQTLRRLAEQRRLTKPLYGVAYPNEHHGRTTVMTKTEKRWYGVSTGDGNSGVSHLFPDYYVLTDDPWMLAKRAAKADTKPEYQDAIEVDGEAEYTIYATIYDDPAFYDDYDADADYSDWESGPAPYILEVFPLDAADLGEDGRPTQGYAVGDATSHGRAPMYDSIEDALGE